MEHSETTRIVGLMGSYREGGAIDQAVDAVLEGAKGRGAFVQKIVLKDRDIEFCRNCRTCTDQAGPDRGHCVVEDDLEDVLSTLENADGVVLAAPVNFGDVNAMTRRLLERMVGYAYWPRGAAGPKLRRPGGRTPAVLITSSAAPAVMTRTMSMAMKTLRRMAKLLGARPAGSLVIGLQGNGAGLSERQRAKAIQMGEGLAKRAGAHGSVEWEPPEHAAV